MQKNDKLPELIVHIRPTTPLRDPFLIDKAIEIFKENNYGTSLRSVHQMSESSYKNFEISNGILKPLGFSQVSIDSLNDARQSFPKTYVANGYVDVLSVDFIRKNGCIHGNYVIPFLTPKTGEIDTIDDLEYIEYQISKNPKLFERLFTTNLN